MKPLNGIRIIEAYSPGAPLALRLAGALAGRILADFGASVSFEEPPEGNPLKRVPPMTPSGDSTAYAFLSAGKHMIEPGEDHVARAVVYDGLIGDTDALATWRGGHVPQVTAVLSLAPNGGRASEFTALALSGVLDIVGDPEREPISLGGHQAAYSAGLSVFTGVLAALSLARGDMATRQTVRVNLVDTLLWINWKSVIASQGGRGTPSRQGRAAEWQVIRCTDGWLALVYQPADWPALCELVGDPALREARFATISARRENGLELVGLIELALSCYTRDEIRELALARRLPLGPVWSLTELLQDRHYLSRGFFSPVRMPDGSTGMMPTLPVAWNGKRFTPGLIPVAGRVSHA